MQILDCEPTSQDERYATRRMYREASSTEMTYIATGTLVVSRSSIAGTVTRAQFDKAIAGLEARYGFLRSAVEFGEFVERTDDTSAVEAWLSPESCTADAVYATLLDAGLDTRKKLYSIRVIAGNDTLDIFMLSSHAITDATSLVELHACLAYLCDCIVRGITPALERQPFPSPVDAAVSQSLASLPAGHMRNPASYCGTFAQIPMKTPDDGQPLTHRLERTVIGAEAMLRISAAAHAHGSSVHSLLLAAYALAIRDVAPAPAHWILMRSSVDMRRRLEPHISPELVFSAITGHITPIPDLDRPLFEVAKLIYRDIHEGVANGSIFHDYLNYANAFGNKQQAPVALNVSDMQSVTFHWPTQRLKVTGFEYACGWLKRFPNVSVSVYDGVLVANTVYVQEFVDPATMRTICERMVSHLLSASTAS